MFKDGFPSTGGAKSATFITLGFLVTFGVAAAVTVSPQVPSIFGYIGLMTLISIPAAVLTVASYKKTPYIKALAVIFIGAAIVGGISFYLFGLVAPKTSTPQTNGSGNTTETNYGDSTTASKSVTNRKGGYLAWRISQREPQFRSQEPWCSKRSRNRVDK